jgi:hypothetical protein
MWNIRDRNEGMKNICCFKVWSFVETRLSQRVDEDTNLLRRYALSTGK